MNVVNLLLSGSSSTEWYPSTASNTDLYVFGGIPLAVWKGEFPWLGSRKQWAFNCWRSTVLRGRPSFLRTTTIRAHQVVGSLRGTLSNIPFSTSLSIEFLTASAQFSATVAGQYAGFGGIQPGIRWMCAGGVVNFGNGLLVLKALLENWSTRYFSNRGMFFSHGR